jgi:integrase
MAKNLTEGAIKKAARDAAIAGKRRDLSDAAHPGLRVRLTPKGLKGAMTWVLACRDREGRMRRFVLGAYLPDGKGMGVSNARDAARKLLLEVRSGVADPIKERQKLRSIGKDAKDGVGTLTALLDQYAEKGKPGSKLKSWKAQRQSIEHVFEKHLARPLATMTAANLQATAQAHGAEYSAALAVRALRPVLKWAAVIGAAPAALAEIHPPASVQRRKRVLSPDELSVLLPGLSASDRPYAAAMRFMLLTLARREEVGSARWHCVDLDAGRWVIPETKNGEPHFVPLSRQAADLLRSQVPVDDQGSQIRPDPDALIFATSTGATLGNWDRETKKIILDCGLGMTDPKTGAVVMKDGSTLWTRHDLRRTGATMLGEMGVLPDIIEAALNHVSIRSPLAATYNRSRYRPQVAAALEQLADALDEIEAVGAGALPNGRAIQMAKGKYSAPQSLNAALY